MPSRPMLVPPGPGARPSTRGPGPRGDAGPAAELLEELASAPRRRTPIASPGSGPSTSRPAPRPTRSASRRSPADGPTTRPCTTSSSPSRARPTRSSSSAATWTRSPWARGVIDDWSGACMAIQFIPGLQGRADEAYVRLHGIRLRGTGARRLSALRRAARCRARPAASGRWSISNASASAARSSGPTARTTPWRRSPTALPRPTELALVDHVILGVGADSMSFDRVGVPTITFDGLPTDRFELIHSEQDMFENVDPEVYTGSYAVALALLRELDRADDDPCPAPPAPGRCRDEPRSGVTRCMPDPGPKASACLVASSSPVPPPCRRLPASAPRPRSRRPPPTGSPSTARSASPARIPAASSRPATPA